MSLQSNFNADEDLSKFLHTVLDKTEQSLLVESSSDGLQTQMIVNQTISLLRTLAKNDNAPINVKPQGGQTQGNLTFSWKPESNSPRPGT